MNKKPRNERRSRILKKRIIVFLLACVCFTAGAICVMILVHFKRPVLISPLTSAKIKQIQNEQTQQINNVKKMCNSEEIACGNITITGDRMIHMTLPTGEEVIVTPEKDILNQIRSLQLTINHFTIEGKKISRIDFRFEKPVITLKQ